MYARPKATENDDDLVRMQQEYFKNKAEKGLKPAAQFTSSKVENLSGKCEPKSTESEPSKVDIEQQLANTFEAVPNDMKLSNVTEKSKGTLVSPYNFDRGRGFPQAKRRDPNIAPGKGSIFSQHIKKFKKEVSAMEIDASSATSSLVIKEKHDGLCTFSIIPNSNDSSLPSRSYILSGSDSKEIHKQNIDKIKSMTEQEILEEKEKLLATMDPAIVTFLKSRRKNQPAENRNPTIQEQNQAGEDIEIESIETPAEIIKKPEAEKWLNFNVVETNKLAWMKTIDIPKIDKNKSFEARFDFEGWLLPYSENEITEKNRILYHHGEDAGRPGYTLQELFQLSRSNVIQQKIIALNGIANILSLNLTGIYDNIIEMPLEQIFFVVRFCLDDNAPAVLNAAMKCMRNLIYFQLDETCLDNLLGFGLGKIQPVLCVDNENEDNNTINDQQLVEVNLTKCLARTEIFTRIKYIITTVRPPLETIVYCIEVLIRLARDNDFIASKILTSEGLLEAIVKHFVPKVVSSSKENTGYGLPLVQAVKLLRVLSARHKNNAIMLLKKFSVTDTIIIYLSDETFAANANGMKLQTECFHFWSLLINYNLSLDVYRTFELPILLKTLDYHFKNTDIDITTTLVRQSHLASVLTVIAEVSRKGHLINNQIISLLVNQCTSKWSQQFINLKEFTCGRLQIISSLILCLSSLIRQQKLNKANEILYNIIGSQGFRTVTDNIKTGSMLLNNYKTHKTSANIRSVEAAAWDTMDHVIPIMQTNSCMPFLFSITEYILHCDSNKVVLSFLKHENIQEYMRALQKSERYHLTNNWFTRIEGFILMNILKTSVSVKDNLDTSIFYELAVKCLGIFNSEQKQDIEHLLNNIIFCSNFYPTHLLMEHLDISQRNTNLELSLNNLQEIMEVYTMVLGLRNNVAEPSVSCSVDINIGNVIPIDWIYTPIIVLYSNQQQNKVTSEEHQIFTIKNCLRWILIYECYFPFLANSINPTDRFCRLACVFLGSDNLFLNKEIHDLLEYCFKNVVQFERKISFKKEIQGLTNFQDFYTQLLEQYQAVSYGDVLFGNILLVPLAQKHNVQYRKTLWSEYMGVVQIFNVTPEQMLCDIQLFLDPPETEVSLLNCYRIALSRNIVRKHSVLYKIASHHVGIFGESQRQAK